MKLKHKSLIFPIIFLSLTLGIFGQKDWNQNALNSQEHVKYLASDECEGRYPGTAGITKARDYILGQFNQMNLKAINGKNTQTINVTVGYELGAVNEVFFNVIIPKPGVPIEMSRPMKKTWELTKDWLPSSLSENGELEAPMVFCGFGISSKDLNYDDYAGIDVKGKIAIILSHSPNGEKKDDEFAQYHSYRYKANNAREHGAKGVIFVKIQGDSANVFDPLDRDRFERNSGILAIQVNRNRIAEYFPKSSLYPTEIEIMKTKKPKSFELPNAKIHIKVDLKDKIVQSENVFGYVEGTDANLKNEFIVVGAHYDHLGIMQVYVKFQGNKLVVNNGADDNASGVAALIELARSLSQNPTRRSVAFVAFTAEELGILGSNAFVNEKIIDPKQIAMMINLDMVGRMKDNIINLIGTGSSSIFSGAFNELDLGDTLSINPSESPLGASDQTAFYLKDIPSIFFFTGVHLDYHKPTDDWDKLNYPGIGRITDFLVKTVNKFGNLDERPPFQKVQESMPPKEGGSSNRSGSKVWFGIVPNFDPEPKGMKISGSSPGSPADKAGLIADDIITQISDKDVKSLQDFTYVLRSCNPGDELTVKFLRQGKEMTTKVKLVSKE
jgi:hypothetical protein